MNAQFKAEGYKAKHQWRALRRRRCVSSLASGAGPSTANTTLLRGLTAFKTSSSFRYSFVWNWAMLLQKTLRKSYFSDWMRFGLRIQLAACKTLPKQTQVLATRSMYQGSLPECCRQPLRHALQVAVHAKPLRGALSPLGLSTHRIFSVPSATLCRMLSYSEASNTHRNAVHKNQMSENGLLAGP